MIKYKRKTRKKVDNILSPSITTVIHNHVEASGSRRHHQRHSLGRRTTTWTRQQHRTGPSPHNPLFTKAKTSWSWRGGGCWGRKDDVGRKVGRGGEGGGLGREREGGRQ